MSRCRISCAYDRCASDASGTRRQVRSLVAGLCQIVPLGRRVSRKRPRLMVRGRPVYRWLHFSFQGGSLISACLGDTIEYKPRAVCVQRPVGSILRRTGDGSVLTSFLGECGGGDNGPRLHATRAAKAAGLPVWAGFTLNSRRPEFIREIDQLKPVGLAIFHARMNDIPTMLA
jgi:hypothetical protein